MPFNRRVVGVSPAPQVASFFNEGGWHRDDGRCISLEVRRTMECDQAQAPYFSARGKSLHCAGCSVTPLVVLP